MIAVNVIAKMELLLFLYFKLTQNAIIDTHQFLTASSISNRNSILNPTFKTKGPVSNVKWGETSQLHGRAMEGQRKDTSRKRKNLPKMAYIC